MKKSLSIVLIAILVLNTLGYYGIFLGLQYSNELAITKSLDEDVYDERQAVTLKIPVSVPYMPDQADFRRSSGKFEHEGKLYRIVKQRYAQDTLTIVCIQDTEHEKIDSVLEDYVKTFSDNPSQEKSNTKLSLNFIKDYLPGSFAIQASTLGWSSALCQSNRIGTLVPFYIVSINQPPELA